MEIKRDSKQDYFIPPVLNGDGISRVRRHLPPAHYLFTIESFSLLSKTKMEKYESSVFEAGGHKWRLVLYPNGNKNNNGDGFISLYLGIEETENLPLNWEVNVEFKLFVLDQIHDQYLAVKDVEVSIRRFYQMRTEWGFSRFLSLESFNDASNGYLVEDSCVFGAEVFVIERTGKWEQLFFIKNPSDYFFDKLKNPFDCTITWKIENFSKLEDKFSHSPIHSIEYTKWALEIFPKGDLSCKGKALSVFLILAEPNISLPKQKIYVGYRLRLRDQINSNHRELIDEAWFSSTSASWGFSEFELLTNLHDVSKGYIENDVVIVDAEVSVIAKVKCFS